jgi:signal transduction histidine kinase
MKQVLINLVKNAVEAAPSNSSILILIRRNHSGEILEVEDEGAGIPAEQKDKIFDLYYSTKDNGSGLGLSIVEKIISAHGGEIKVESPYERDEQVQTGTRFRITLPDY